MAAVSALSSRAGHAPDEHSHQPGRHLIVGNFVVGVGTDEELDFVRGEFAAIALFADEVEGAHGHCRRGRGH